MRCPSALELELTLSPVKSCWVQSYRDLGARACPCIAAVVLNLCVMMEAKCDARVKGQKESDSDIVIFGSIAAVKCGAA